MTLFWFLAGLAVCIGISRYNEDDALFWKLFISFVGAFTAATVVKTTMENENQEKVVVIEDAPMSPTQVPQSTPCINLYDYTLADVSRAATKREKSPKPVSKDSIVNFNDSSLSKVFGKIRGQPQLFAYFNTS